jgi:hypothetical protein
VQRYAATQCEKYHPRRRRAVPQLQFDQDDVRFELRRVRCGLPTNRTLSLRQARW